VEGLSADSVRQKLPEDFDVDDELLADFIKEATFVLQAVDNVQFFRVRPVN
jgi:hypothetical protein